jgi:hypothetical protein
MVGRLGRVALLAAMLAGAWHFTGWKFDEIVQAVTPRLLVERSLDFLGARVTWRMGIRPTADAPRPLAAYGFACLANSANGLSLVIDQWTPPPPPPPPPLYDAPAAGIQP